jgi:hypothetical protein
MNIKQRRRQVAWICFEPHLSKEQLIQSIQILERDFQLDDSISLMTYVAKICMKMGIDLQNHKALLSKFTKLMAETTELSVTDPLLLIDKKEKMEIISNVDKSQLLDQKNAEQQEPPIYTLVFASFMGSVLEQTPNKINLFTVLTELVADKKLQVQDLTVYVIQWVNSPNSFIWSDGLNQQILTRLVHLVYMGLCEALGPVAADDCFHKALVICEQKPEAKIFAPSQFL